MKGRVKSAAGLRLAEEFAAKWARADAPAPCQPEVPAPAPALPRRVPEPGARVGRVGEAFMVGIETETGRSVELRVGRDVIEQLHRAAGAALGEET